MKDIISRPMYMKRIEPYLGQELIKVLIGQRRVGKSYFLLSLMKKIRNEQESANIIYIDKENNDFNNIKTDEDLLAFVTSQLKKGYLNYLCIDEVQEIINFERALRSLNGSAEIDIYITGSNANLLSRELSTLLAGRCIEINIHGLSYNEFLSFHSLRESEESFLLYVKYGGLPYLRHLKLTDEIVYDYLKNIYQTILYRDIITRHHVRNSFFLERLVLYLADTVGSIVSAKKISDFLKSQRSNMSTKTILQYLRYLTEACFINKVSRYDIQGKKIFKVNDKYYFEDLGLRHSITGFKPGDINKNLENLVYNHLVTKGFSVHIGKLKNLEINFLAERHGRKKYYQVCYLLPDEKVIEREFGNLSKIPDQYPKYVISMDPMMNGDRNGIKHIHIRDFLLQ